MQDGRLDLPGKAVTNNANEWPCSQYKQSGSVHLATTVRRIGFISFNPLPCCFCQRQGTQLCIRVSFTCDLDCEGPQGFLTGDLNQFTKTFSSNFTQLARRALQSKAQSPSMRLPRAELAILNQLHRLPQARQGGKTGGHTCSMPCKYMGSTGCSALGRQKPASSSGPGFRFRRSLSLAVCRQMRFVIVGIMLPQVSCHRQPHSRPISWADRLVQMAAV